MLILKPFHHHTCKTSFIDQTLIIKHIIFVSGHIIPFFLCVCIYISPFRLSTLKYFMRNLPYYFTGNNAFIRLSSPYLWTVLSQYLRSRASFSLLSSCLLLPSDTPTSEAVLGASLNPQNIREGDDVYFECHVRANPRAYKVVWKHNVSNITWAAT